MSESVPGQKSSPSPEMKRLLRQVDELRAMMRRKTPDGKRLTGLDLSVAEELLSHIHRTPGPKFGLMWPSVKTICLGVNGDKKKGERSVRRSLSRLRALGYFSVMIPGGGIRANTQRGEGHPTYYALGNPANLVLETLPDRGRNPANLVLETLPDRGRNPANLVLETLPDRTGYLLEETLWKEPRERDARAGSSLPD
jgi:hypothetical protein